MTIPELINSGANITLTLTAGDLRDYSQLLLRQAKQELRQEAVMSESEVYYTTEQAISKLNISKPTLWRWANRKYLMPIKVGGLHRYRKSDIDKIINTKVA